MPTETQNLEQRVAVLQSDLNARDQALDDAATENNERELSRRDWFEEAQRLEKEVEELRALLAQTAEQHQGEPIRLTAVAELVDDGDGGLEPSWILEGGTAELFAGMTLLVADNSPDLCHEDGSAEVYTRPGAPVVPEGWQLVPTVPTDDMIVAFAEAWYSKRQTIDDPDMLDAYRDMLVVAPSPPQQ